MLFFLNLCSDPYVQSLGQSPWEWAGPARAFLPFLVEDYVVDQKYN